MISDHGPEPLSMSPDVKVFILELHLPTGHFPSSEFYIRSISGDFTPFRSLLPADHYTTTVSPSTSLQLISQGWEQCGEHGGECGVVLIRCISSHP